MPSGIQQLNEQGRVVFSSDDGQTTFVLKRSGQIAASPSSWGFQSVSQFNIGVSDVPNAVVAISGGDGYGAALWVRTTGILQYLSDAPPGTVFNYFVFVEAKFYPFSQNYGFEAFNSAGEKTFASLAYTMRTLTATYGAGLNYPGKQLAYSHGVYTGRNVHFNFDPDSGGVMYDQTWSAYGLSMTNGGSGVAFREVYYVNGRFGPTPESFIGPDFYVDNLILIINVTNIPIGVTVF